VTNKKSKKQTATITAATAETTTAATTACTLPSADRLISKTQLLTKIPISYVQVWSLMREGKFPRSVAIGNRVAWVESEVDA